MHRGKLKLQLNLVFRRWYSFKIRNNIFPSRRRAGGLILNSQQANIGRLLWKYFNAPGNVMFVTFNLVTFAGLVTFNSLISTQRKQFLEAQENNFSKQSIDYMDESISEEFESQPLLAPYEYIAAVKQDTPIREYTADEIYLQRKASKLVTFDSQIAKMSLFHMMYAYFLMKYVTSVETKHSRSLLWEEEVEIIKDMYSTVKSESKQVGGERLMRLFYCSWRKEFDSLFDNLHQSQKFHFPDWKYYPENMRYVCSNLYKNDMNTIDDFARFYESVHAKDLKKLLRLWFSDNCRLIRPSVGGNKEAFYCTLIRDSYGDGPLFDKYSSILLNPEDTRKRLFFPVYARKELRTASIDTVLSVLQGYIKLQEKSGIQHNGEIIRLISMIKKDCVIAKNKSVKGVRIILPNIEIAGPLNAADFSESVGDFDYHSHKLRDRQKCYELVSQNPKVLKLLDKISKWKGPTTT